MKASKNPYRIMGIVFSSIAAAELLTVLILLVVKVEDFLLICLPFAVQCPIFGGIGAGFLIYDNRKRIKRERLLSNGYYEMAIIAAIEQNPYVRVKRHHPYHVICRINRNGVIHEYRSEGFYHLPAVHVGDSVPVYLDRQNEKNYYVDVQSAEPEIIRH